MRIRSLGLVSAVCLSLSGTDFGQTDIVKTEGMASPLHRANVGRITFMSKPIPIEKYTE